MRKDKYSNFGDYSEYSKSKNKNNDFIKEETINELYKLYYNSEKISKSTIPPVLRGLEEEPKHQDEPKAPNQKKDPQYVLHPFEEVFLEDKVLDTILTRTAIPELLEGTKPGYSGIILYGPPGTGKTAIMNALKEVYTRAGAYAKSVALSQINSKYVGDFAKSLEEIMNRASVYANSKGKPSIVLIDEASVLVQRAEEGSTSVAKHYQEAIDVLKRYIGNNRNIILVLSTNELPTSFEEALTREGRLTSQIIDYPRMKQRSDMWQYFASKYGLLRLSDNESMQLAENTPQEQGAFIEEFCRTYQANNRARKLKTKGHKNILSALKQGEIVSNEEQDRIEFSELLIHVQEYIHDKMERLGRKKPPKKEIGFKTE